MKLEDIQITYTYPPEVEALRQQILALVNSIRVETEARAAALPRYSDEHERIRKLKSLQRDFIEQTRPLSAELARLENFENFATVRVSKAA